jgi:DNA-directed RNA polymerase specialized sigma24 family protein
MENAVNRARPWVGGQSGPIPPLLGDEEELFRRHHRSLVRAVGRCVSAPNELVEDACQHAWVVLLRRQPTRTPALFAWLRTVALHQAYRLSQRDRRDARLEELAGEGGWEELVGTAPPLETAVEARAALASLAALPASQRTDLALLIGGFSYREIARSGERRRSLNNVNKHLTKARARLRSVQAAA